MLHAGPLKNPAFQITITIPLGRTAPMTCRAKRLQVSQPGSTVGSECTAERIKAAALWEPTRLSSYQSKGKRLKRTREGCRGHR